MPGGGLALLLGAWTGRPGHRGATRPLAIAALAAAAEAPAG